MDVKCSAVAAIKKGMSILHPASFLQKTASEPRCSKSKILGRDFFCSQTDLDFLFRICFCLNKNPRPPVIEKFNVVIFYA